MTKEIKAPFIEGSLPRKKYASPHLVIYGNISRITQSVDMSGRNDNGKGNNKT